MNTGEKIYTQHADHTEWMNKLKFYTDEISIMKGRLEEIASKNSHQEVLAQVEHFQNQFIVQKNNIDEISHVINLDEKVIEKEINKNPVAVDHREMPSHSAEKESMDAFEKNFNELRTEFKTFAAKWM
jgi:predicted RNA-binding protein